MEGGEGQTLSRREVQAKDRGVTEGDYSLFQYLASELMRAHVTLRKGGRKGGHEEQAETSRGQASYLPGVFWFQRPERAEPAEASQTDPILSLEPSRISVHLEVPFGPRLWFHPPPTTTSCILSCPVSNRDQSISSGTYPNPNPDPTANPNPNPSPNGSPAAWCEWISR